MDESKILEILIQGGAVGIAVLMILYSAWKDKLYNKTINNHLTHNTQMLYKVEESSNLLKDVVGRQNSILERIERILDRSK